MLVFVCRFDVEVSRYISVVSEIDIYVKERYVSRRVRTGEFDGKVNAVKKSVRLSRPTVQITKISSI